ncbi:MAG: ParA family protein [Parcubacteria group bacterium]|nr:ParA family protein [Parcubacteria group bacterium]
MARVIAICNQKGGVGKTTTAVNLGVYLAAMGRRVLLVDFDPQANATSALTRERVSLTIYHAITGGGEPERYIKESSVFNYQFVPASQDLAGALVEFVNQPEREYFLRKFITRIRHKYDYILIDLPPSLSLLTVNGLVASDEVIIPVQCEYYGLEGLGQLLNTINLVNTNLRHPLRVAGAVLTMYDKREHLSREVAHNLRKNFPHKIFDVEIPRAVALAEAPSFTKTIFTYAPYSYAARAYERLAREIINQEIKL